MEGLTKISWKYKFHAYKENNPEELQRQINLAIHRRIQRFDKKIEIAEWRIGSGISAVLDKNDKIENIISDYEQNQKRLIISFFYFKEENKN